MCILLFVPMPGVKAGRGDKGREGRGAGRRIYLQVAEVHTTTICAISLMQCCNSRHCDRWTSNSDKTEKCLCGWHDVFLRSHVILYVVRYCYFLQVDTMCAVFLWHFLLFVRHAGLNLVQKSILGEALLEHLPPPTGSRHRDSVCCP